MYLEQYSVLGFLLDIMKNFQDEQVLSSVCRFYSNLIHFCYNPKSSKDEKIKKFRSKFDKERSEKYYSFIIVDFFW